MAVAGQEIKAILVADLSADLKLYYVKHLKLAGLDVWQRERIRAPDKPEDCLVVADPLTTPLPLTAARIHRVGEDWHIYSGVSLGPQWQGAFVVSRTDGALIGVVKLEKKRNLIRVLRNENLASF